MTLTPPIPRIAIACGGTGGHLFPGLAVGRQLVEHGCDVTLLISSKQVDQEAAKLAVRMEVISLPAVALKRGSELGFLRGFYKSYRATTNIFRKQGSATVLGMGGFTTVAPILAAKRVGARTFLHESNTIPGRANRLLARFVDEAFVGFPTAAEYLKASKVVVMGTPVRAHIHPRDPAGCRQALGLDPARPVVLVLGGSQGASGINQLVIRALPCLAQLAPELQWLHLAGVGEVDYVNRAYAALRIKAVVHSFLSEMEMALGAATAAITRAGASTLAELAAVRLPAVLIPFPNAADDHQLHNARAFEISGAACLLEQNSASPERVAGLLLDLLRKPVLRDSIQHALAGWHVPLAAEQIAERILLAHELMFKARAQPSAPIARLSTVDSQAPPLATRTS